MSYAQQSPANMRFKLHIIEGKSQGREFFFEQPYVTIGRMPNSDLVLYDTGVSRSHCEISYENDQFVLRDMGSANGTLLNDSLTTEAYIYEGDRIRIGPVTFEFKLDDEDTSPGPTAAQSAWLPESATEQRELGEAQTKMVDPQAGENSDAAVPPPVALGNAERSTSASSLPATRRYASRKPKLRRSSVVAVLSTALVLTAAIVASYLVLFSTPKSDRSGEVFAANESNAELRFGAGKVDVYTPRGATFAFDYEGGKATLEFATGGIDSDDEVSVELNGKTIGHAPASPARWTAGHTIDLPRELLYNGRNLVVFRHHPLAGAVPRWGVARVLVKESALPKVDYKKAERLFDLGKTAFNARTVAPPNLSRSIGYLEEARLYLEGADERPPLYYDIGKTLTKAKRELQETFDSHIFAAEQAIRFGERERASESLRELLQYIPDEEDARHEEARSRLEALESP